MNKNKSDFELLAPAGSFEGLKASFAAGADAAYIGGSKFGARAYADSTGEDCIEKAIDYAHLRKKKLYLTVNTLLKEDEIKNELYSYILPYYEQGLDAVIVQDMGVMDFLHKEFPKLSLHASTQMTITGSDGAVWAKNMGAARIVTAREMSLDDIREISRNVDIEIEAFVHGAMCYCYSGQCLMSSLIGGRSGNRGRCAQPCRLPYDVFLDDGRRLTEHGRNYILSLKDMCTIEMLPELMEAGVMSFKIEGRMKSPVYTAGVVSIYRKYMDMYLEKGCSGYSVEPEDRQRLFDLFDRGGQTDGYLRGVKGKSMMALKEKPAYREIDLSLVKNIEERFIYSDDRIKVKGHAEFTAGQEASLTLSTEDIVIKAKSGLVSEALNHPVTFEEIEKRLKKTGETQYVIDKLTVNADDNIFISVKEINELRRKAISMLEEAVLSKYRKKADSAPSDSELSSESVKSYSDVQNKISAEDFSKVVLNAFVETDEQLDAVLESGVINTVYLDSASFPPDKVVPYIKRIHKHGMKCIYVMPAVFKCQVKRIFEQGFRDSAYLFDGISVKNIDEAQWLKENVPGTELIGEPSLYAYNSQALDFLKESGINKFIMPLELNFAELIKSGHTHNELIVYGRTPVMITEQCIMKNTAGCKKTQEILLLKDRKQMVFPVKNKCVFCYNVIYNSVQTSLINCKDKAARLFPSAVRLDFTVEDRKSTRDVIDSYYRTFLLNEDAGESAEKFTKGHFSRGIE